MYAAAMSVDLHIPESRSLETKRAAVKPIVEGLRRRFNVAVAEVDHQDQWQRCLLGVAAVASSYAHLTDILDEAERFIWSRPDIQVLSIERNWLEEAG
jgi:uncharacterized protein